MRRYTKVQHAVGWPMIYRNLCQEKGVSAADAVFQEAERIRTQYAQQYTVRRGIHKMHTDSAIAVGALYLPLKNAVGTGTALRLLEQGAKPTALAKHRKIEKLPAPLFMKAALAITSVMFSEKAGFRRRWVRNTPTDRKYDLLTCPYVEVLTDMGCPEVCPAICVQDEYSFCGLKNGVVFARSGTLGRGDACCDFHFYIETK